MIRFSLALAASILFSVSAHAIPQTFVSVSGSNANTCERAAPCRTFSGAIAKTDAGGEIVVLDAGEYGQVTINKSVRITAVGIYAGITAPANNAITINVAWDDVVAIRGLTLTGKGGAHGIAMPAGGTLHVESCTISGFTNFTGRGINFAAAGRLYVKDTVVRNCASYGIFVGPTSGSSQASIENCSTEKNGYGISVQANSNSTVSVAVKDSVVAGGTYGFHAVGAGAHLSVFGSQASHQSAAGFFADRGGRISAENSIASGSGYGFAAIRGGVVSIHNCTAAGNFSGVTARHSSSVVSVEGCQLVNNTSTGLFVSDGAAAMISGSIVTGSDRGLWNDTNKPGTLKTFGNNSVHGNTTETVGVITPVSQM